MKKLFLIVSLLAGSIAPVFAQTGGGDLPALEFGDVTITGKRTVSLPKARKGEVVDTSLYQLPPGDPMLFGQRITNLSGTAGSLPGYREYERPLKFDAEASIGSYLSPRLLLGAEFTRPKFDIGGTLDFRSTAGHIDSAQASSLQVGVSGSVLLGEEVPPLRGLRAGGEVEHLTDNYFLYGNSRSRYDRTRSSSSGALTLKSEEDLPVGYSIRLQLDATSVDDKDTVRDVSAMAPMFSVNLGGTLDSLVRFSMGLAYSITSLRYATPTNSPTYLSLDLNGEWEASPGLFLGGGVLFASGQNSDSGSSTLLMPRASVRYALNDVVSLFGWFSPELRGASYGERIMRAPYVDPDVTLRPERVPVRLAAGVHVNGPDGQSIEVRGFFESAENTPVVVAGPLPGELRYQHIASRTIGGAASLLINATYDLKLSADALLRASVDSNNRPLPMIPLLDLRGGADYTLSERIDIFGSVTFQTEQRTTLSDSATSSGTLELSPRFLLGLGGSYSILGNLKAFVEMSNLLGLNYDLWQNYSAPRFEIRGGVRGTF